MDGRQPVPGFMTATHDGLTPQRSEQAEAPATHGRCWPLLCGGRWSHGTDAADVTDPDNGEVVAQVAMAGRAELEGALSAAARAASGPAWPAHDRAAALTAAADGVASVSERFTRLISAEGIKTIREARREVARAIHTLRLSAAAAFTPAVTAPATDQPETVGWRGTVGSTPVGVVAAITPYNDPLNLVAHKVGPALAAGNAIIVKPDERTPLTALLLGSLLIESGVPPSRISVLPAGPAITSTLVADPRVRFVNFTGGRTAGALLYRAAGMKRTLMELGGICPTIVLDDADLDIAVPALIAGAYGAAGQNCLHVQRILIHRSLYAAARARLIEATENVRAGPKAREDSDMGPLIDAAALRRVGHLVEHARQAGASLLTGGAADGPRYLPTLLEHVPAGVALAHEEIFGPVTSLEPFDSEDEAIELANHGGGGIQAGLFTSRPSAAERLAEALDFGSVVIGGTSDHRSDALPFGGTGRAGIGREGVIYATAAMTETKTLLFNDHSAVPRPGDQSQPC